MGIFSFTGTCSLARTRHQDQLVHLASIKEKRRIDHEAVVVYLVLFELSKLLVLVA
jgi:hypothetical protein